MASERIEEIRTQVKEWSRNHRDIAMYLLSEVYKLEIALESAESEIERHLDEGEFVAWIRTANRLPECPEPTPQCPARFIRVLGVSDGEVSEYTYEPRWSHGWTRCGIVVKNPPTHWMPLPSPPLGDD